MLIFGSLRSCEHCSGRGDHAIAETYDGQESNELGLQVSGVRHSRLKCEADRYHQCSYCHSLAEPVLPAADCPRDGTSQTCGSQHWQHQNPCHDGRFAIDDLHTKRNGEESGEERESQKHRIQGGSRDYAVAVQGQWYRCHFCVPLSLENTLPDEDCNPAKNTNYNRSNEGSI